MSTPTMKSSSLVLLLLLGLGRSTLPAQGATPPPGSRSPATQPSQVTPSVSVDQDGIASTEAEAEKEDQPQLLKPIPKSGDVPPIVEWNPNYQEELRHRARLRGYKQQLTTLRYKYFRSRRLTDLRQQGLDELKEFTDPAAFMTMIEVLAREQDDVRLAMLDHFATCRGDGQAALAWVAINDRDQAIRHEASKRINTPAESSVLHELDVALRSSSDDVVSSASILAGTLHAAETIPLLIFAQAAGSSTASQVGDLAWIAIETQLAFVQNLIPVVGDASGAMRPVIGVVSEGSVLRVMDAYVIVYRTIVHRVLVAMTSDEWGESTDDLNYNINDWWYWYNEEYVPFKNEFVELSELENNK